MRYLIFLNLCLFSAATAAQTQSLYSSSPTQLCVDERNSLSKTANQPTEADPSCKASLIEAINCCNGSGAAECSISVSPTASSLSAGGGITAPGTSQSNLIQLQVNGVVQNESVCKSKLNAACASTVEPASAQLKQNVLNAFDGLKYCLDDNIAKSKLLQFQDASAVKSVASTDTSDGATSSGVHSALQNAAASANTSLTGDAQEADLASTVRRAISAVAISSSVLAGNPTIPVPLKPELVPISQSLGSGQ